mmetsp:Transcript_51768/g.123312  ORF Transcript_51768/g.123312 Transcript_51768/m.123312 type:complete len:213 (-) Transcript_51768:3565-4203(-)
MPEPVLGGLERDRRGRAGAGVACRALQVRRDREEAQRAADLHHVEGECLQLLGTHRDVHHNLLQPEPLLVLRHVDARLTQRELGRIVEVEDGDVEAGGWRAARRLEAARVSEEEVAEGHANMPGRSEREPAACVDCRGREEKGVGRRQHRDREGEGLEDVASARRACRDVAREGGVGARARVRRRHEHRVGRERETRRLVHARDHERHHLSR